MRRWQYRSAALLLVAACASPVVEVATSAPAPTTSPTSVIMTSSTAVVDGFSLPVLDEITGDAPVRLSNPPAPVVYLTFDPAFEEGIGAPDGLMVALSSCAVVGPGVLVYETVLSGDGVAYPFMATVEAGLIAGDEGSGLWGVGMFEGPGRQLIVAAVPSVAEGLGDRDWGDPEGASVGREARWARAGQRCELTIGGERAEERHDLEQVPGSLEITAPEGTVEELAQLAFGQGMAAPLLPLAVAYGEATDFYAERWFLPSEPTQLLRIKEELSSGRCLEVEFLYSDYTITQRKGCPSLEREAVFEAGGTWFATGSDGTWLVEVAGDDRAVVTEVMASLRPAWHLFHRRIPLTPVNEREIGRASYQGGEVLVTFGEQRCSSDCRSPEGWFFVYRIFGDRIEEYANYPGWDGCLLVEEEPFALGVGPRLGRVEITDSTGTTVIENDEERPFAFVDRATSSATVEIFDQSGETPRCVGQLAGDTRGGIEQAITTFSDEPDPETSRTVEANKCGGLPQFVSDFTDEDPVRAACSNSTGGVVTLLQVIPNAMMAEPPDGLDCIVAMVGMGSSASCWQIGSDPEPILSRTDDFGSFAALVPEGTTRILGVTSRGTELIGIPFDRLALVWWRSVEGELRSVVAETPSGNVPLFEYPG